MVRKLILPRSSIYPTIVAALHPPGTIDKYAVSLLKDMWWGVVDKGLCTWNSTWLMSWNPSFILGS